VPSVCSPDMPPGPFDPRRNLWPLVGGQSLSLLGDYLAFFFALPVFVRDLTGSAAQLGLLAVFETAAVVLFGFIAGVLIDRVRVRRIQNGGPDSCRVVSGPVVDERLGDADGIALQQVRKEVIE